jgi:deoxyribose-phosphate aldolase
MMADADLAKRLLGQLDLTGLSDTMLEDDMERLIQKAITPHGAVAALCIWPRFVSICASRLNGKGVHVSAVINFPQGGDDVERAIADAEEAVNDGAHEIELVFPAKSFCEGDEPIARSMIAEVKDCLPDDVALKLILEPGSFPNITSLEAAARISVEEGASALKAGTGRAEKTADAATLTALLGVIRETGKSCGLIVAGPFRHFGEARAAFTLASDLIGESWADADRFRLASSSLYDILLKTIGGKAA